MSETGRHTFAALPDGLAAGSARAIVAKGPSGNGPPNGSRRVGLLARALESTVIPRLVLARQVQAAPDYAGVPAPTPEDRSALTAFAAEGNLPGALALVAGLAARGVPLERVYLELLAPVARDLGEMWLADACSFTTVTVGLCCLQQLVLESHAAFGSKPARGGADRRALLAPTPGDQHSFGILMVGEFFRRGGWEVTSGTGASARELVATVRAERFDVVGLSLSSEDRLEALAAVVHDIRRATLNPRLGVLVGGPMFLERPELAVLVGADATATDGQAAVLKAETLLALLLHDD